MMAETPVHKEAQLHQKKKPHKKQEVPESQPVVKHAQKHKKKAVSHHQVNKPKEEPKPAPIEPKPEVEDKESDEVIPPPTRSIPDAEEVKEKPAEKPKDEDE